jgi:sporulation protein YqfC
VIAVEPKIEMAGNREIIVDGCLGVVEYGENLIKLNMGEMVMCISGDRLVINSFDSGVAVISGQIGEVSFVS